MSPEQQTNRRSFMKRTAMGTAGISLTLAAGPFPGKVLGANDKIAVGLIGCGDQGCYDLKSMMKTGEIVVSGLCDVSVSQREKAADLAGEYAMENPIRGYKDFRELLECPKTDAVIIATPDHWHALPMVMACQAGKDVYVEKPLSLTIYEGRKMVKAARKYERVVQTGTQQRSGSHFQKAVELVRSGRIGKVSYVRTFNYDNSHPEGIGNPADCDPPVDLDWDFWLGLGYGMSKAAHLEFGFVIGEDRPVKIGYGYDFNTSNKILAFGQSHELNLSYNFGGSAGWR